MNYIDNFKLNEVNHDSHTKEINPNFDPDTRILANESNDLKEVTSQNNDLNNLIEDFDPNQRIIIDEPNFIVDDIPRINYPILDDPRFQSDSKRIVDPNIEINLQPGEIWYNGAVDKEISSRVKINEEGKYEYYDDDGKLFRIDNQLLPNHEYKINGYIYKTDDQGRVISAEGRLHTKNHEGYRRINDSMDDIGKGDQKETDDRGHLIGDQFGGSNGLENIIPQDANLNRKDIKNLEDSLAQEVNNGKDVNYKIEPLYESVSNRPEGFVITYSIDGETTQVYFENGEVD